MKVAFVVAILVFTLIAGTIMYHTGKSLVSHHNNAVYQIMNKLND